MEMVMLLMDAAAASPTHRKGSSLQSLVDSSGPAADACLGPITPDSKPIRNPRHQDKDTTPCTPNKDVFDPFPPGPHNLMLAPYATKDARESRLTVPRQLTFPSCSKFANKPDGDGDGDGDDDSPQIHISISEEDMMLFDALYFSILEAIISTQYTHDSAAANVTDGFTTPTSAAPHLTETCPPPAPLKPTNSRFRSIHKEICRKLDFS